MPKGIYDRTTSAWRPRPKKEYDPALVKRVAELYNAGHTIKEVAELTGVGAHVIQRLMPRNGIARRPAAKRDQRGPRNHAWKGDAAKYAALHLRVESARGKPAICALCDTDDPEVRYEWANLTGEYENPQDYVRLCVTCHRRLDQRRRRILGRRTMPEGGDVTLASRQSLLGLFRVVSKLRSAMSSEMLISSSWLTLIPLPAPSLSTGSRVFPTSVTSRKYAIIN